MNMDDLARQLGISRATVYRRARTAGITLARDGDGLTQDTIDAICRSHVNSHATHSQSTRSGDNRLDAMATELEYLRRENDLLRDELEHWRALALSTQGGGDGVEQ